MAVFRLMFGKRIHSFSLTLIVCVVAGCSSSSGSLPSGEESGGQQFLGGNPVVESVTDGAAGTGIGLNTSSELAGINSVVSELGLILRDIDADRTLYTLEDDANNTSSCFGSCELMWPPLRANNQQLQELAPAQAVAEPFSLLAGLSIITRIDGSLQWAFNGAPLYRFSGDQAAGDTNGEGVDGVWFVARPFAWQIRIDDTGTEFFAGQGSVNSGVDVATSRNGNLDGFSLYTFIQDTFGLSTCNAGCVEVWPPFFADRGARVSGGFTIITRNNGTAQWAFNGQPLYFFINDVNPGDTNGDGAGGIRFLARP